VTEAFVTSVKIEVSVEGVEAVLRVGFALTRCFSMELAGAYLSTKKGIQIDIAGNSGDRAVRISGTQNVSMNAPSVLLSGSLRFFETTTLTLRLMAGVAFTSLHFGSDVAMHVSSGDVSGNVKIPPYDASGAGLILGSGVRLGYRVSSAFTLDLGILALLGSPPTVPSRDARFTAAAPPEFPSVKAPQNTMSGNVYMVLLPTLGGRFDIAL
jgi:hypothetical protein